MTRKENGNMKYMYKGLTYDSDFYFSNPVKDKLNIHFVKIEAQTTKVNICNSLGQLTHSKKYSRTDENIFQIDISHLT